MENGRNLGTTVAEVTTDPEVHHRQIKPHRQAFPQLKFIIKNEESPPLYPLGDPTNPSRLPQINKQKALRYYLTP